MKNFFGTDLFNVKLIQLKSHWSGSPNYRMAILWTMAYKLFCLSHRVVRRHFADLKYCIHTYLFEAWMHCDFIEKEGLVNVSFCVSWRKESHTALEQEWVIMRYIFCWTIPLMKIVYYAKSDSPYEHDVLSPFISLHLLKQTMRQWHVHFKFRGTRSLT